MKIELKAHVEFSADDENDLCASLQLDYDDFFVEKLQFSAIFKRQSRGLSKADKADFKKRVIAKLKKFLAELEN